MIFVVLGTQKFQLNRLLKKIDELIERQIIEEEVVAQVGCSDYKPRHFKYSKFMAHEDFLKYMEKCDLLITHGGVGSIIEGINRKKKVLVIPRLKAYGEHVDDHQTEIAESFVALGTVVCCNDGDLLEEKIKEARSLKVRKYISGHDKHLSVIRDFLSGDVMKK